MCAWGVELEKPVEAKVDERQEICHARQRF